MPDLADIFKKDFSGGAGSQFGGGWGMPYVPVTPLGALEGFKGDLLLPIVAIGVSIFLLVLIVLAVKAALSWKLSLLKGMSGEKFRRDTNAASGGPPGEDQLNRWMNMLISAMQSESCAKNVICQIGDMVKDEQSVPSFLRMVEAVVPSSMQSSLQILRSSAEGSTNCDETYKCNKSTSKGPSSSSTTTTTTPPPNNPNSLR